MSFDLFDKATDEHSQIEGAKILFPATVGEPLLDKRILDFVKLATQKYSKVSMFTNTFNLPLKTIPALFVVNVYLHHQIVLQICFCQKLTFL